MKKKYVYTLDRRKRRCRCVWVVMDDLLLQAVEELRNACPPEPIESEVGRSVPALVVGRRDAIVAAARQLSEALLLAPPLVPLQLEVLLRQTVHLLSIVRAWAESGTAEAAVGATLCCLRRLLRVWLLHQDEVPGAVGVGKLLSSPSARPATCELLSTLLVAASDSRASRLRASCVRTVWRVLLLPLDPEVVAYVLPGVATQLAEIGSNSARSHAPTCLAALGAMRVLLCMSLEDGEVAAAEGQHDRVATEAKAAAEGMKRLQRMAATMRVASSGGVGAGKDGVGGGAGFVVPAGAPFLRQADLPPGARFVVEARDAAWWEQSAERLAPLLLKLGRACAASTRVRVRMRLVLLLDDVLRSISRRALRPCAPAMVELLAGSARDEILAVRLASRAAITALAGRLPDGTQMGSMLAASFERQLAALPRIVCDAAEPPKARAFLLLASQLELIAISGVRRDVQPASGQAAKVGACGGAGGMEGDAGAAELGFPRLDPGQLLASRLGHVCSTLFAVLRFAPRSAAIEQRIGTHAVRLASGASARRRLEQLRSPAGLLHPFLHLKDAPTVEAARALGETLGRVSSVMALTHQLMPVVCSTVEAGSLPRREAAWLLSRALAGAARGIDPVRARVEAQAETPNGVEAGTFPLQDCVEGTEGTDRDSGVHGAADILMRDGAGADDQQDASDVEPEQLAREALLLGPAASHGGESTGAKPPRAPRATRSPAFLGTPTETDNALTPRTERLSACEAAVLEECVLMLLREVVSPAVWERRADAREMLPLGEQHAVLQEQWLLLELVGSCFEVLGAVARATTEGTTLAHDHRDHSPVRPAYPSAAPRGIAASESQQVAVRLCLLPVLGRLGDDAAITSEAAERALCRMVLAHQDGACRSPREDAQHRSVAPSEPDSTDRQGMAPTTGRDNHHGPCSVRELLARNGDFLLDAISRRLRHAAAHPRVPLVLEALLTYAAVETLPLLSDVVDDIIGLADGAAESVDVSGWAGTGARAVATAAYDGRPHAGPALVACARAMRAVVVAAVECQQAGGGHRNDETVTSKAESGSTAPQEVEETEAQAFAAGVYGDVSISIGCREPDSADCSSGALQQQGAGAGELGVFFDNLFADIAPEPCAQGSGAAGSGDVAEESLPREEEEVDEELERAKQEAEIRAEEEEEIARSTPPLAPGLALRVVAKLEVLLLCAPPAACHVLLDALMAAIPLLSPWPRALLPVLHTLWAPLTQLLHANDLALSAKAMDALTVAASILRAEISSASVKAVFPPLLRVIRAHGSAVLLEPVYVRAAGAAAVAPRSRQQDALLAALRLLRALCRIPRAATPRAAAILCELEPLLSSRQPERVRTEAVTLGKELANLQRDAVWLFCARVTPPAQLQRPPQAQLHHLSTAGMRGLTGPPAEFAASAAELLLHVEREDQRESKRLGLAGMAVHKPIYETCA